MNDGSSTDRLLRSVLWGTSAFCAVYLLQGGLQLTGFVYDPVARSASFGHAPVGVQMRYFGDVLGACAAFGVAFVLAGLLPLNRPLDIGVLAGTTFALFALDLAFFFSRVLAAS